MAFRAYQKIKKEFPTPFTVIVDSSLDGGVILEKQLSMDEAREKMPDPSMYDVEKSVEAGVNLDAVNTKILM